MCSVFLITFDRCCSSIVFLLNYIGYEVGERGLARRNEIWKASILQIRERWIFGHGLLSSIGWITLDDGGLSVIFIAVLASILVVMSVDII